jgi:hypothetical protein
MTVNRVNVTPDPENIAAVQGAIQTIYDNLHFLIDLKPEERQKMAKFGDKNRSFVVKALAIAEQNPGILPPSFSIAELRADVAVVEDLYPLIAAVTNLLGKLEDTHFAAGSEAYTAARVVYQYAKIAQIATGALEDAVDDLGHRFVKHPKTNPPDSSNTPDTSSG